MLTILSVSKLSEGWEGHTHSHSHHSHGNHHHSHLDEVFGTAQNSVIKTSAETFATTAVNSGIGLEGVSA